MGKAVPSQIPPLIFQPPQISTVTGRRQFLSPHRAANGHATPLGVRHLRSQTPCCNNTTIKSQDQFTSYHAISMSITAGVYEYIVLVEGLLCLYFNQSIYHCSITMCVLGVAPQCSLCLERLWQPRMFTNFPRLCRRFFCHNANAPPHSSLYTAACNVHCHAGGFSHIQTYLLLDLGVT